MTHTPIIAIIDDDDGVRVALTSLIRSLGYAVRGYVSAIDFLDENRSGEPDCLICDIQMPQMSGDELQAGLLDAGRNLPIIFMTVFPTALTRERVLSAGAQAVLEKPVDGGVIAHHLEAVLKQNF